MLTNAEIFNADETRIFYELTPSRTLKIQKEKCLGETSSKERTTVMMAVNMSGTVKKKLLVIGLYEQPRCWKNVESHRKV